MTTSKPTVVKYVMTNGLMAEHSSFNKPFMAKVEFAIMDDDSVVASVVSAHTGNRIKSIWQKTITREELQELPENPYNDMVFNEAAFDLMGIKICGA